MATMNVSLPDAMKDWVETCVGSGRYANASDYVRDLIRKDREQVEKIAHWRRLIDEAEAGGPTVPWDVSEFRAWIREGHDR